MTTKRCTACGADARDGADVRRCDECTFGYCAECVPSTVGGAVVCDECRREAEREGAMGSDAVQSARREAEVAFDLMTDDEKSMLPLNLQEDGRPRVRLAHIEAGEGAPAGQGTAVVSVPAKYARLAWAMVTALNLIAAERASKSGGAS